MSRPKFDVGDQVVLDKSFSEKAKTACGVGTVISVEFARTNQSYQIWFPNLHGGKITSLLEVHLMRITGE